jgi:hypothetical protein
MREKSSVLLRRVRGHFGRLALAALIPLLVVGTVSAQTIITFPWDWHISVAPNVGTPGNPSPSEVPVPIWLWGTATVQFGQPVNMGGSGPPTFDLGPGGGLGAPIPAPVPPGGPYEIPIELVSMELHSMMDVQFPQNPSPVPVAIRESPTLPSLGRITNLQNIGGGMVQLDSFFDIFVEIELPGMTLHNEQPWHAGMSFQPSPPPPSNPMVGGPLPDIDILWGPTWIWNIFPPGTAPVGIGIGPEFHPWDWPIEIHGHVTIPEPSTLALVFLSMCMMGLAGTRQRSH